MSSYSTIYVLMNDDKPGYHGLERFNDHDKMVELLTAANEEGLSVHAHSTGNGATHFMLGCIEDAEKSLATDSVVMSLWAWQRQPPDGG